MSGTTNHKKKNVSPYLLHLVGVVLILLTAGCGDNSNAPATGDNTPADASRTGSATFSVQWQTDNTVSTSAADAISRSAITDCSAVGIESITCVVYDPSDGPIATAIANGGPWKCTDGGANMAVIPEGSNLTFAILGWDTDLELDGAEGNIIYQGVTEDPVTIVAGETTNAGEIVANPFVPTDLVASAVSISEIELTWRDMGASSYQIYQDGTFLDTSASPSFSITDLEQYTEYCYTVSAVDVFDNESGQSIEQCATTGSENDTLPPTVPTSVNAVALSENQIDISWEESTDNVGVSRYEIYRNGESVGSATTLTFSDSSVQPDIEYCYTVVAYDAADNVSDVSAEACARPHAIITVNIDSDFRYVGQGFPMGLSPGETAANNLGYEPREVNLIEPPYDDLYVQYSTRYGFFEMGNSQDNIISFVIVEDYSSISPERYRIYIDSNNNEDLTDDGGPHVSLGTTEFAVQVSLNADIITDSGDPITRQYQLWMWVIENTSVRFYATCHYAGEILVGGQTFTAVAYERSSHDALYRENGLFIDLNSDGRIDLDSEYFSNQDMVTVGGQGYELILDYP